METILVFEHSPERRESLTRLIRTRLDTMGTRRVKFHCFSPEDVFARQIPERAGAVFFALDSMYDAEAARKLGNIRSDIPMVFVSDSDEYCLESWEVDTASYYIRRPFGEAEVGAALEKCKLC